MISELVVLLLLLGCSRLRYLISLFLEGQLVLTPERLIDRWLTLRRERVSREKKCGFAVVVIVVVVVAVVVFPAPLGRE
ncbi:hypothetical protein K457DRAFT_531129 [Linnemannia elongata AG-77]|uniref:Uncharacterized protein n=1 Tax=Linnemannia elongata AG-77 TaxID=1314771 RepID=A0A197JXE9_9FUNG|nr:hypothetical protein K457DRAFT_531129 [Linnemannia elongata AG-77]